MGVYDDTAAEMGRRSSDIEVTNRRALALGHVYLKGGNYWVDDHGFICPEGTHGVSIPGGHHNIDPRDGRVRIHDFKSLCACPDCEREGDTELYFTRLAPGEYDAEDYGYASSYLADADNICTSVPGTNIAIPLIGAPRSIHPLIRNLKELVAMPTKTPDQIAQEKASGQEEKARQEQKKLQLELNKLDRQLARVTGNWKFARRSLMALSVLVLPLLVGWVSAILWAITASFTWHQHILGAVVALGAILTVLTLLWAWGTWGLFTFAHTAWKTKVLAHDQYAEKQDELYSAYL